MKSEKENYLWKKMIESWRVEDFILYPYSCLFYVFLIPYFNLPPLHQLPHASRFLISLMLYLCLHSRHYSSLHHFYSYTPLFISSSLCVSLDESLFLQTTIRNHSLFGESFLAK